MMCWRSAGIDRLLLSPPISDSSCGVAQMRDARQHWNRSAPVDLADFSRDGALLATASTGLDGLQIWSTTTGAPVMPPLPHDDIVLDLDFRWDGQRVIAGCASGLVHLWDVPSGDSADRLRDQWRWKLHSRHLQP